MIDTRDRVRHMKQVLGSFLKENPDVTPLISDDPVEIVGFVVSNARDETRSFWLRTLLEPDLSHTRRLNPFSGAMALIASALIVAAILVYGVFFEQSFLKSISDPAQARGLITFLFAFGTIAVILIISISVFWMDINEVEKRVSIAKDILTILIGVFGTILGFYFGSVGAGD